jgi:hypothetical protein
MSDGMTDMFYEETEILQQMEDGGIQITNAFDKQVGGKHYTDMVVQPVEFIVANSIGFLEGNIIKYICRHQFKHGAEDIKKAIHYCELLLHTKYGE